MFKSQPRKYKPKERRLSAIYSVVPFDLNEANLSSPTHFTEVSNNGWNPNDPTKLLFADDFNLFMFRTNFTGDLKTIMNLSGSSIPTIPTTGNDYYNLYNCDLARDATGVSRLDIAIGSISNGANLCIYNSAIYSTLLNIQSANIGEKYFLFPGYMATIRVIDNSITNAVVFVKITPPEGIPEAATGQTVQFASLSTPSGFIPLKTGTIGGAGTGATILASYETRNLFVNLWDNFSDTYCPVSGGRGANAIADFEASKTIALYGSTDRAMTVSYAGGTYANGQTFGAATVTLVGANNGPHQHDIVDVYTDGGGGALSSGGVGQLNPGKLTELSGSGTPFDIHQPSVALPFWIKL